MAEMLSTKMVETCVDCRKSKGNGGDASCDRVKRPMYAFDRNKAHLKTHLWFADDWTSTP